MSTQKQFHTQKINFIGKENKNETYSILKQVYDALDEKGYDPLVQIVGYVLSGDPTYITGHNGARSLIGRLERDELLEEVLHHFMESKR